MAMIEVLKWDAAPHVLAYQYPDCELNYKSQLIVTESQEAVLVKEGKFYGPIGPGRHMLETKNFPFLTKMGEVFHSIKNFQLRNGKRRVWTGPHS